MSSKILFFDIDGTLLAGGVNGGIPESAVAALKKAQENGHYLFINSGRTSGFIPEPISEFPFDGYLCGCGIEIIFRGEKIYYYKVKQEATERLIKASEKTGVQLLLEGQTACFVDKSGVNQNLFPPLQSLCDAYADRENPYPVLDIYAPGLDYDKFVVFYDDNCDINDFIDAIKEDFSFIPREDLGEYHFAEFIPVGHSKATGMDVICDYLGLSHDDTYAFGDSNNDLTMLEHAKYSVAMGNSFPDVFPLVDYITTPINRDGIQNALKHYKLI